jgi:hypothetical protein
MSAIFLHITFDSIAGIDPDRLKRKLDIAGDWIHYAPNCWIVRTSGNAARWYRRLKPLLTSSHHIFICKLDLSERQGWLSLSVWDWIHKYDEGAGQAGKIGSPPV